MEQQNPDTSTSAWTPAAQETAKQAWKKADNLAEAMAEKTPSLLWPLAALASIAVSAMFQLQGRRQKALFVGQWAPTFMLFGLFTKLVKAMGAR